jgi:hypothetical protein
MDDVTRRRAMKLAAISGAVATGALVVTVPGAEAAEEGSQDAVKATVPGTTQVQGAGRALAAATLPLVPLFVNVTIPAHGNATGPAGGLDLTGYREYRLVLRFDGPAGTPFVINELYGPAGGIDQLNTDIASGTVDPTGFRNYRGNFLIYGPKSFFIRVLNNGTAPLRVNGSLYAIK